MRASILNSFIGALGLAAIAASAPGLSSYSEDCIAPSTQTIFVTVPASSEPSTVYVTVPASYVEISLSEAPTTTMTRVATLYSTATFPHIFTKTVSASASPIADQFTDNSESTFTKTAILTITNVNLTPPPSESYVYVISTATVVPVDPTLWSSEHATSTLTLHSTVYSTQQITLTKNLESVTSTVQVGSAAFVSAGTGLPYTKPVGGWNATKSSSSGGIYSGATNAGLASSTGTGILATGVTNAVSAASTGADDPVTPSFRLYPTFDIYQTSRLAISLSSFAAKSGFNAFTTVVFSPAPTSSSYPAAATSESDGKLTTALIDGETVTWGASSVTESTEPCTETAYPAFTGATYTNSSSITSSNSNPATPTLNSSGELTAAVIDGQTVTWGGLSATFCTETPCRASTTGPYANSTFATFSRVASGTSGAGTSLVSASSSISYQFSTAPANSTVSAISTPGLLSLLSTVLGVSSSFSLASSTNSASSSLTSMAVSNSASASISSTSSQPAHSSSSTLVTSTTSTSSTASSLSAASSSFLNSSSISLSKTSTSVSSTASATPSLCGEHGDFLLDFDDVPPLSIGNQNPNTVVPEPVFNPYHQFDFSDGFVVVPPPTDPYLPSSPPLLLEFIPNFNVNGTNTQAGPNTAEDGYSGQISDGDGDRTGCFHFNVYGASFGCDSQGPPCVFTFSGYQLDASRKEVHIASQSVSVPACPALANCTLTPTSLDNSFQDLAFVRINVTVAQQPKIWWMDDLRLGWYNNSCTTGLCRQTTHLA